MLTTAGQDVVEGYFGGQENIREATDQYDVQPLVNASLMSQCQSVYAMGEGDLSYVWPRMRQHATSRNRIRRSSAMTTPAPCGDPVRDRGSVTSQQRGPGMTEYATAITFPQTSTTYEAFSKLSAAAGQYGVRSAGIIERDAQGQLRVPESGDTAAGIGIASGSVIGMLVGVLGGPIGMLLGWSVGAATGALYDADRLDTGDEAIAAFGRLIPPGGNAILAVTDEVTTDPLEQFAAGFGGKVSRRPLDEVLAELEAQDEAAREADKAARKAIREQKKRERKEDFQTRVDALKAKFQKE